MFFHSQRQQPTPLVSPLAVGGFWCATRRHLATENDSRSNRCMWSLFQLACKLGSAKYCLLVVRVRERKEKSSAWERGRSREKRETDSCLKFTALSTPQVRPCSLFILIFGCLMFTSRRQHVHASSHAGSLHRCAMVQRSACATLKENTICNNEEEQRWNHALSRMSRHALLMRVCVIV